MYKLLLLEDDISLIDGLEYSLQKNDFTVETVRTVGDALKRLQSDDLINQYDLLLLDVTLPDGTGFEVCEKVREENSWIPIVFLTASDEEVNVIRGLDGGGDDYITKPFKIGELCSRIRALLRRASLNRLAETAASQKMAQKSTLQKESDDCILSGSSLERKKLFAQNNAENKPFCGKSSKIKEKSFSQRSLYEQETRENPEKTGKQSCSGVQ